MKGLFIAILSVTSESINAFFPRYVHWPQQSNPLSRDCVKRVFKPFLSLRNRWMANVAGKVICFKYENKIKKWKKPRWREDMPQIEKEGQSVSEAGNYFSAWRPKDSLEQ